MTAKAQVVQAVSNLSDTAGVNDPYRFYSELRRSAPVYRVDGTDCFMASTWDAVQEAVSRTDAFSSNLTAALVHHNGQPAVFDMDAAASAGHVLATADDPRHDHQRRLVLPGLVAKRIRALEPYIAYVASRLFVDAAYAGRIEWMSAVGDRLPMTLVARLIGLPDSDVPQLVRWGYVSTELLGGVVTEDRLPVVVDAAMKLADYLHDAFTAALATPADNLLGDLARAVAAGDIDNQVAVLMLVQLVGAGGESSAGLIGNAARLLATRADLQEAVRTDPDRLPTMLEETLRLESPFRAHHRHVTKDTTLAGVGLPVDSHLMLLWGSANRDPAVFDHPDEPRLDRPNPRGHLAFGKGLHFCVGAALARTEARAALHTLLDQTNWITLENAEWLPSIFLRRHTRLELAFR